jgi:2-polyprenyl-3-methyl-5-hydroxy-6-metoxy-1,4-benzoquinol methylase
VTIAPLEEATFADEAFDLIVLREAIEHFLDPDPVLQRLAR